MSGRSEPTGAVGRLTVVYLDHVARLSGGEVALLRTVTSLPASIGAVVLLGEDGPLREGLAEAGVRVEVLPLSESVRDVARGALLRPLTVVRGAAAGVRYVLRTRRRLRELEPDVIHTNSLKSGVYGGLAALATGVPVVWHLRDRLSPDYMPRPVIAGLRLTVLALAGAVVVNSRSTLETLGVALRRPHLVLHDPYRPASRPPDQSRPRDRSLVVGVVGRLAPWKGQDVAIRAFAEHLRSADAELRIIGSAMFGESSYEAELRHLSRDLSVSDRVTFRGHRPEVERELAELDVLVHCSVTPEPFGQVVVEGMAAGLPVVAAAAGGPSEIVTDGVDGLLTPPGDVAALGRALRALADDPELRERLGRAASSRAADFVPEVVLPALLDLYRALARGS